MQMLTLKDFDLEQKDGYVPLSSLITESEAIVDSNHASTVRSLSKLSDIIEIGTAAENKLYEQGDKLLAANDHLDIIDKAVVESKDELKSISSVFGQMRVSLFGRTKVPKRDSLTINRERTTIPDQKPVQSQTRKMLQNGEFSHLSNTATIAATEDNIDEIAAKVDIVHQIALNMGHEINGQNVALAVMNPKIENTTNDIKQVTRKVRRQI